MDAIYSYYWEKDSFEHKGSNLRQSKERWIWASSKQRTANIERKTVLAIMRILCTLVSPNSTIKTNTVHAIVKQTTSNTEGDVILPMIEVAYF